MKKQAQERGALNKMKQVVNVKRHLTRMIDSKYKKLSDNTEALDKLIRNVLNGSDRQAGFMRKVQLAESNFARDNYLGCGVEMTDAVKMLTDAKAFLDKANLSLADSFEEITKSRFEEEGGTDEDLIRSMQNLKSSSLQTKAYIIKEAGISSWIEGLKTNLGDMAYKASNFSLWKKIFSKNNEVVKATGTMVDQLRTMSTTVVDSLEEMSHELAASDLESYYSISSKLSVNINKFIGLFKTYMTNHFDPLIGKLTNIQEIQSSKAIDAIHGKSVSDDLFKNLESVKFTEFKQLDYEDLMWLGKLLATKVDIPALKTVKATVERILNEKYTVFKEMYDELGSKPGVIDSANADFFVFLGYQSLSGLKNLNPEIIEKMVNRLDQVKTRMSSTGMAKAELIKKQLMEILMNRTDAKEVSSGMTFSHIKNSEAAEKISGYVESGKLAKALKALDYEIALNQDDRKKSYILNQFRDRLENLDK